MQVVGICTISNVIFCTLLSRKPFLKEKTSDETKYAATVIETFILLGKMMSKCPASVCCEIASAVASFYSDDHSKEENITLPAGTAVLLNPQQCDHVLLQSSEEPEGPTMQC